MTGTPYELLDRLTAWATGQGWIDWLELGGSLGRGGGDAWSDIDAGIGVADGAEIESRRDEALRAIAGFAPVADTLVQSFPSGWHCVAAYADGRQLSLVVLPAEVRTGLPPQSRALLDRSGRLARPLPAERWAADAATRREWAFLAWIGIGDAARHAVRGRVWRALRSLTEARDHAWRLWAAESGVPYPAFGAVGVENADLPAPPGLAATHPADLRAGSLLAAAGALADVLTGLEPRLDALEASIRGRLSALRAGGASPRS